MGSPFTVVRWLVQRLFCLLVIRNPIILCFSSDRKTDNACVFLCTRCDRKCNISKELCERVFLIPHLSHQLALMMILTTWSSLSKICSSTPGPLVHFAPKCY